MKKHLKTNNKKLKLTTLGFTLIELLAVIVILAVIALIATPLVLNTIEEAKKGAFEQTLTSIVKASELYQAKAELSDPITECRYFSFGNDVEDVTTRDDKVYYPIKELNLKGELPTKGEVKICKDEITFELSNGVYSGSYDGERVNVVEGDLASSDSTKPTISFENIPTTIKEGDSYTVSDYLNITYGSSGGNYSCTVDNLNELSIGVNNLECEVVGNTGLKNSTSINVYVFNPDYVMTEGNQLIWSWYMSDTGFTRYYYKTNEGFALVAYAYDSYTNWTFPVLVSKDPTKVIYNTTGDYTMTAPLSDDTIDYLGETWYISYTEGWMSENCTSIGGNALKLETDSSTNTLLEVAELAAMKLLDEALKQ